MGVEQVTPVWIPANTAVRLRLAVDRDSTAEISVITGGPIFLWFGEDLSTAQAASRAAGGANMDWDAAASSGNPACIGLSGGVGAVTAFAEADTRAMIVQRTR